MAVTDTGRTPDGMPAAALADRDLFLLLSWLSPAFPVGAFAYSSGLEWAVEAGDIKDAATLQAWLTDMVAHGSGFSDAVFLAQAHGSVGDGETVRLSDIADLATAMVPSRERHLETTAQGRAFVDTVRAAWAGEERAFSTWLDLIGPAPAYPVAVGTACGIVPIALAPALVAFLHAIASNWISAAARLVPLGQTDAQRTLAALEPLLAETARRAAESTLDAIGTCTFRADLASLRHETQYTRLFRS